LARWFGWADAGGEWTAGRWRELLAACGGGETRGMPPLLGWSLARGRRFVARLAAQPKGGTLTASM
jgi:hypothetical protein